MRIDKFIAGNSHYSRAEVARLIKQKQIHLNSRLVLKAGQHINTSIDVVSVEGSTIKSLGHIYLMLNKPIGYVCSNSDNDHPTVLDLIRQNSTQHLPLDKLQIAGRLDVDTTGLVLITTDGDWNHRITSPAKKCIKRYIVETVDPINTDLPQLFSCGITLKSEKEKTKPAQLTLLSSHKAQLDIYEGKYHQVKRMFAACGNRVSGLQRISIGAIQLDPSLKLGEFRTLTVDETAFL